MDMHQFDSMTTAIGTAPTRRGVIRALLGGALAMVGADTLAQELGVEKKAGDGDKCKQDNDCGKGLFCKKIHKKRKKGKHKKKKTRFECRYKNGCGKKRDFCDHNDDCCSGLKCNRNKNRCQNK